MDEKQDSESSAAAVAAAASSYRYWVREVRDDAAPLPLPRKLTEQSAAAATTTTTNNTNLGSVWNSAGTWEEKNLNKWATTRIKELIKSAGSLEFLDGKAEISQVSKCIGDAFLVTVRNKKRVGYTFELTLEVKGEWNFEAEKKKVIGHIDIHEFSFGEVDELEIEVTLNEEKDIMHEDKLRIRQDLKMFMKPLREKLLQFEEELKDR